ncbi:MAG: phosphatase PAP2 family protein [Oscillospiraceae bacterium]|nr:phosphatase PAP2 family protein [Oscillospiraceae bacterium]
MSLARAILSRLAAADEAVLRFAVKLRAPAATIAMRCVTMLGDAGVFWFAAAAILLAAQKTRRRGAELVLCLAVSSVVNNGILKNLIKRPRPYDVLPGVRALIGSPAGFSFPSGHTAVAFAAAYAIFHGFGWRLGVPAYIVAAGIAASRVYLGVHYPSDALAGIAAGILCAALALKLPLAFLERL